MTSPSTSSTTTWSGGGPFTLSATATDNVAVGQVDFYLDGSNNSLDTVPAPGPYNYVYNSTLPNGAHTVQAKATDTSGNIGASSVAHITQTNSTYPTLPTFDLPEPNFAISNAAYNGFPNHTGVSTIGHPDSDILAYMSVVDCNKTIQASLRTARSAGNYIVYSTAISEVNGSGSSQVDWLNYADTNTLPREDAFIHVTAPTTFPTTNGSDAINAGTPWMMFNDVSLANYISNQYTNAPIIPGTLNKSLYIGLPDKFRGFTLSGVVSSPDTWTGVVEYYNGTAWATLPTVSDTTVHNATQANQNGTLDADHPTDWVPLAVASQPNGAFGASPYASWNDTSVYKYYFLRIRCTTAGTAPTATSLNLPDYTGQGATAGGNTVDGVTNGTTTLTSATAGFNPYMVGRTIQLSLNSGVSYTSYTIATYVNPTTVTLSGSPSAATGVFIALNPTVPAFDYTLDAAHGSKGYHNAADYGSRAAGFDAHDAWQGRCPHSQYGFGRFPTNVPNVNFQAWCVDFHNRIIINTNSALGTTYNGISADNMSSVRNFIPANTRENIGATAYIQQTASIGQQIWNKLIATRGANSWVMSNLSNTTASTANAVVFAAICPATYFEGLLRPFQDGWPVVETKLSQVFAVSSIIPTPIITCDSDDVSYPTGTFATEALARSDFQASYNLACYYYMAKYKNMSLEMYSADDPETTWIEHWTMAQLYDLGADVDAPLNSPITPWHQGNDPANAGFTYKIYKREFANGVVLYKPCSFKNTSTLAIWGGGSTSWSLANLIAGITNYYQLMTPVSVTATGAGTGGVVRITCDASNFTSGSNIKVALIQGTSEANGSWTGTKVDATHIDLAGTTFVHAMTSSPGAQAMFCNQSAITSIALVNGQGVILYKSPV